MKKYIMNYWVITDSHFGHDKLQQYTGRPKFFEEHILQKLYHAVTANDILIHLGDFCIGEDLAWHEKFMEIASFKKWLIRGNHDKKSYHWYLQHGWDFVGESVILKLFGKIILLSHKPQPDCGYDINIHGHFHNNKHSAHEPELVTVKNNKQKLLFLEHDYKPFNLRKIIEAW